MAVNEDEVELMEVRRPNKPKNKTKKASKLIEDEMDHECNGTEQVKKKKDKAAKFE